MNPVTDNTPKGSPVGSASGAVHLLQWTFLDKLKIRVQAMCGGVPRGNMVERTGEDPTCQKCVDEVDYRAAQKAGFEHLVHASRVPLGHSPVAGNNAMRYGSKVTCNSHRTPNDRATVIWSTNNPGKLREAEEVARQHFLTAYRESLAAAKPAPATAISPERLVELRAEGRAQVGQFVDPHVLNRCVSVLRKRGEPWAAAVLGRDISRRSIGVPGQPYLQNGEEYTLVAADAEEDRVRFDQIIDAEIGG